ncbi:MAG: hypothetical protein AAF653_09310 [Chloroflexota bacterium]
MLEELKQIGSAQDLKDYQCKITSFSERHLLLNIRIHHPEVSGSIWYLNFVGVYYVEGPIFWTGADFNRGSDAVSFDTWKSVHPEQSSERLKQIAKIFDVCTVKTAIKQVVIAYSGLTVSKDGE